MAATVVFPANGGKFEVVAERLTDLGYSVRRLPPDLNHAGGASAWTPATIDKYFGDADAFLGIFLSTPISEEVFARAKNLRLGVSPIIGTESIDIDAATRHGVLVAYGAAPENFEGVAEAIVMLACALVKRLPEKWEAVRSGGWRTPDAGKLMSEITLGMIGFGNIGRATAGRLSGFGTRLIAYDPYVDPREASTRGVELVDLPTLLAHSDVVSVMTVLNEDTHHLIGEDELGAMKSGSYLINTSRGPCVDEAALIASLASGHLGGAAIDTFESEPAAADNPLRSMPNVISTAHNIGHAELTYERLAGLAVEQLVAGLRGEVPQYVRNPSVLPRWLERVGAAPATRR